MSDQQQRYRVVDRLASGGMAEVFVAESAGIEGFKKTVAIKRVLPHLSEKKRFIAMFLDEARTIAKINHPNVVHVIELGEALTRCRDGRIPDMKTEVALGRLAALLAPELGPEAPR